MLANHIWSFADAGSGAGQDDISNTFLQAFLAYNTKTATTFSLNTETTYDWTHAQGTVPDQPDREPAPSLREAARSDRSRLQVLRGEAGERAGRGDSIRLHAVASELGVADIEEVT
jgi:hypothetical protein